MTTLLVVDDSAMDRLLAGGLLEKHPNWTVHYAVDGRDALSQMELHLPDVVVTDLQMPEMNGLELVKALRRQYPLVPVILMTAKGSEEIAVEALHEGAASYVPKRLLSTELVETVERVLMASGEQRSHSRLMLRMLRNELSFELENDLSLLPSLVNFLQQLITRMRLVNEPERLRVGVALEEALLNAYYHGNLEVSSDLRETSHSAYYELARQRSTQEPYRGRRIFVDVKLTPAETVYVIRDEGPGFNPACIRDATDPANIERPCGRGLLLMKTFMDEVIYNETGNQVTLIKHFGPPDGAAVTASTPTQVSACDAATPPTAS